MIADDPAAAGKASVQNQFPPGPASPPPLISPDALAAGILLLGAVVMVIQALIKPLWTDELFTWITAALPSAAAMWHSLATAPLPLDPPLFHWSVHFAMRELGDSEIAVRLVSIAGMLAALWFLYLFLKRTGDPIAGLLAMSILMASGAFTYGTEARPYALVLAAAAGALVCWQNVVRGHSRRVSLVLFAVCLAVADSCHYYSILICVPFAAGELVRFLRTRFFDWPVLAAMVAGNGIMAAYLPLIPATRAYQGTYWRGVFAGDVPATYRMFFWRGVFSEDAVANHWMLFDSLLVIFLILLAALVISRARRPNNGINDPRHFLLPEETAALVSFALYPLVVFALSLTVTHTYGDRFALPAILALAILLALSFRVVAGSNVLLFVVTGILLCSAPLRAIHFVAAGRAPLIAPYLDQGKIFDRIPGGRIMVTDVPLYLAMLRYAPDTVRRRMILLDMVASPTAYGRKSTGQMMALGVRVGLRLPVLTAAESRETRVPFFVVCRCSRTDLRALAGDRAPTDAGSFVDFPVFTLPAAQAP
jgi:hypothetical protein